MSGEKTEKPTPKKLDDARKKGQTSKSPDVNAAMGLIGLLICLLATGATLLDHLSHILLTAVEQGPLVRDNAHMMTVMTALAVEGFLAQLPMVGLSVVLALVASFAQVGFLLSFEPLTPDFDKINPASGIKRLFSVRSLIDFSKMVLKAAVLGWVLWVMVNDMLPLLIGSAHLPTRGVGIVAWTALLKLLAAGCLVFIVIGPVDFGVQKWLFKRDQKMSKEDIKREHKDAEGDPLLKNQRKQIAHEMANSAPEQRVPNATVVVTNPTHYAVALRYAPGENALPVVVAKGANEAAARIRAIAQEHRVPIVGNPPLARALHRLDIDSPIPEPLFEAVATVLRWVTYLNTLSPSASPSHARPPRG